MLETVIKDLRTNEIIENIRQAAYARMPLAIKSEDVRYIRKTFIQAIHAGEQILHGCARSILNALAKDEAIESRLMVFGRCYSPGHSGLERSETAFSFADDFEFLKRSDSYLAKKFAPVCSICGLKTESIASFVHYRVLPPAQHSKIIFVRTRIKSTSHIAYKLADIVFDIDNLFKRDKIQNQFTNSITDVYGMKVIVQKDTDIQEISNKVSALKGFLRFDTKDYTGQSRKKSGYEALKSVFKYEGLMIEVQFQSKRMFDTERQSYTASHQTYKELQMEQRKRLGKEYTVLYEALYKLFTKPDSTQNDLIELGLSGKGTDDEF